MGGRNRPTNGTRRLRDRDVTAPDAEEADEEGPAARIDSSRCIHDDFNSDGNTSHVARTRTEGVLSGRAKPMGVDRTAVIYLCLFTIMIVCST